MTMESFLLYFAVALSIANALFPVTKAIAKKTKTKTDDEIIEILEEALKAANALKPRKK